MAYTPTQQDEACTLQVRCTPGRTTTTATTMLGQPASADTGPVEPPPPATAADIRAPAPLPPTTSPAFRALSYNILADQYVGMEFTQKYLLHYCPRQHQDADYRKQLVLAELARYSPDVACLQEVDDRALHEYLAPQLGLDGFSGRWVSWLGSWLASWLVIWLLVCHGGWAGWSVGYTSLLFINWCPGCCTMHAAGY
jgi:hypothetical protein